MRVTISNSLVARIIQTSLKYVQAPVNMYIDVLFMPGKAFLIYLHDENNLLGYEMQRTDGIFYVSDVQESIPVDTSGDDERL